MCSVSPDRLITTVKTYLSIYDAYHPLAYVYEQVWWTGFGPLVITQLLLFRHSIENCTVCQCTTSTFPLDPPSDPGPPPYPPNSFDRVLVDAPCSALGQRPQPVCQLRLRELLSYPPYQRKLLAQVLSTWDWTHFLLSTCIPDY